MPINSQKLLTIVSRLKQLQNNDMVRELVSSAWDGINPKTKLTDSEEKDFMDWYLKWAMLHKQSLNPDDRGHHYDYRGYWKEARPNFVGTLNSHLPDTYKTPGHPTFSVESKYYSLAPGLAGSWNGEEFVPPQKVDLDRIRLRQRYAESTFNDRAVSKAGAKGAFQIMPKTYEQYAKKIGEGDLFDPEYNGRMRDAIWEDYYNSKTASNGTPTDQVRVAKALAMYNAGWGRVGDWLDKQKKAGVDIYGSLDWVDKMPWKETRDYVNFILNEKDTGSGRTNAEFNAAVKKYGYAEGGKIHIDPSEKGTFTAAASKHGKSVQAFASQVLANKENYSPAMVKKANFARNAAKWHADGGLLNPAVKTATLPGINTVEGKRIAKNIANRVASGEILLKDVPKRYQNYVEGEVKGAMPTTSAINKVSGEFAPYALGLSAGPVGAISALAGESINNGISAITKGEKQNWGDLFVDANEYPFWNMLANLTNPGFFSVAAIEGIPSAIESNRLSSVWRRASTDYGVKNAYNNAIVSGAPEAGWLGPSSSDASLTRVEPYAGYIRTIPSNAETDFVNDVEEAVNWANARGKIREPKFDEIDLAGLKRIGRGAEAVVYEHPDNPYEVLKIVDNTVDPEVQEVMDDIVTRHANKQQAIDLAKKYIKLRNKYPYNMALNIEGLTQNEFGGWSPVYSQGKVVTLRDLDKSGIIYPWEIADNFAKRIGEYNFESGSMDASKLKMNNIMLENDLIRPAYVHIGDRLVPAIGPFGTPRLMGKDFKYSNIGITHHGDLMGIDLYKCGGDINK